ncbi:MAG: NAD-dependent epimerase/dehydratase family protein [Candidatus Promineifilaceae bacterium]|nr:NAD-dependent epimerase/dehydratase family protein [Candidatus Promineifilaceae bacterium]
MKAFVTGGAGFIGRHVVRKLIDRGYEVVALARSPESAVMLSDIGAEPVRGDITNSASMREGMLGSDVVFHLAGMYAIGGVDPEEIEIINVGGTRKVLRLAHELGVPKIIYTSTINVFGDTKGVMADESFYADGPFRTEYDRTKWLAHYKVALPLIEKGAPITIVMPGPVYGPGDQSILSDMMRLFYRGFPAVPGPDTVITFTHVEDVAEGHILAAEKGHVGETYILTGPAIPLGEIMDFWGHLTGKSAPSLHLPSPLLRAAAPLADLTSSFTDLDSAFSKEGASFVGATYMARSDKARAVLGWHTRSLQTGMLETFEWIAETEDERRRNLARRWEEIAAHLALISAALLLVAWLFGRRRKKRSGNDH